MKKILVTTDFSTHSKAGLRFAIQLATQKDVELVFFTCFQALIPTTIHKAHIENSLREQTKAQQQKLEKFVAGVYKSMKIAPGKHRCVAVEELNPENAILDYAHKNGFNYICISTRGAGKFRKIIGTNTSIIIVKSGVPVIAVPHTWRTKPIKKILYSSDLENVDRELLLVNGFAKSVGVQFDLGHFFYPSEIKLDAETLASVWRQKYPQLDRVLLERAKLDTAFAAQLDGLIKKVKPSIAVFFTHTNKTWFDKIFSFSHSEAFSFATKVPMLVYRKIAD